MVFIVVRINYVAPACPIFTYSIVVRIALIVCIFSSIYIIPIFTSHIDGLHCRQNYPCRWWFQRIYILMVPTVVRLTLVAFVLTSINIIRFLHHILMVYIVGRATRSLSIHRH